MKVTLLKADNGAIVHVVAIPGIKYGPFQMCLSTYNESELPQMKVAIKDFQRWIAEQYRLNNPNKPIILQTRN